MVDPKNEWTVFVGVWFPNPNRTIVVGAVSKLCYESIICLSFTFRTCAACPSNSKIYHSFKTVQPLFTRNRHNVQLR